MRIIVVAGGTGGHIFPAVAIINKIKEKEKDSEVLYIGTTDRMEKDIIPKMGINFIGLEMSGLNRKNLFKNFSVCKKFINAINKSKEIIKEFKPDFVIGVGGYITDCCKGRKKTYKGYVWKYKKDWEDMQCAKSINGKN